MGLKYFRSFVFFVFLIMVFTLSLNAQALNTENRGMYVVDPSTGLVTGLYKPETISPSSEKSQSLHKTAEPSSIPVENEIPQFREITSRQRFKYVSINGENAYSGASGMVKAVGKIDRRMESFWFLDNALENDGYIFIPPDPIAAAGKTRLIAVVNTMIELYTTDGYLKWRTSLKTFFSPLGDQTLDTYTFDPKVVYDHYADRFVVVTLEQTETFFGDEADGSRILLAVSKTGSPRSGTAADWNYFAIDATIPIYNRYAGREIGFWADYPGFEVDEEVIYITANMFSYVTEIPPLGFFRFSGGSRLWIVPKSGFYKGNNPSFSVHDPYGSTGLSGFASTTMPAQIFGEGGLGGPGSTLGTYLVSYSGLTYGGPDAPEAALVLTVDDPVSNYGGPYFGAEFVDLNDLENVGGSFGFPALPDAPQSGSDALIEVNDRRALDAVYRDGSLWMVTTINPNSGADAGQTSAHWIKMDASGGPGTIVLADEGTIGGEDIAPGTTTFFPAVAVNKMGEAAFGFSASAPSIYAGAYVTGRQPADSPGEVHPASTVRAGEDYYIRTFGGGRNRWGDYSGISVDPRDERYFWVYNEYATSRGTLINAEDGRWATAYARFRFITERIKTDELSVSDPAVTSLDQNSPNPFNPETEIRFYVPEQSRVVITIYNTLGQVVNTLTNQEYGAGSHSVRWNGLDRSGAQLASGVYFFQMRTGDFNQIRKMTLLR